jgi:hypothetical protein
MDQTSVVYELKSTEILDGLPSERSTFRPTKHDLLSRIQTSHLKMDYLDYLDVVYIFAATRKLSRLRLERAAVIPDQPRDNTVIT